MAEPHTAAAVGEVKQTEAANGDGNKPAETSGGAFTEQSEVSESQNNGAAKEGEESGKQSSSSSSKDNQGRGGNDARGRGGFRGRGSSHGGRGDGGGRGRGRGRGRGGFQSTGNRKDNIRTQFERKEESSDATEIRRQVDFYFSDSNLPIDKFLLEETGGPQNKPFPLKTIHNFKRMRHFQPFSAIVDAVKTSDFLEVNDQNEIYRKVPLDAKFTLDVRKNNELLTTDTMLRSIYAKGFGEEQDSTAFDIEEFFQPYGVLGVRLRRHPDGAFKGSVFVEFENEESAVQYLEMEEKPKFNDNELKVMSKRDYVEMKSADILEGKVIPNSPRGNSSYDNNNNRRGGRGRGRGGSRGDHKRKREERDADEADGDDWKKRRDRFLQAKAARGGHQGRDNEKRDQKKSRSRSRSPYRANKGAAATAEKSDAVPASAKPDGETSAIEEAAK